VVGLPLDQIDLFLIAIYFSKSALCSLFVPQLSFVKYILPQFAKQGVAICFKGAK
jgi:hypothetical protein